MCKALFLLLVIGSVVGCDGGSSGDKGGAFRLIQFLEDNQANVARNHEITFLFSEPVKPGQDFAQRLKVQSVQTSPADFTLAIGVYVLSGDRVTFKPRLPNLEDRGDAGFRSDTNYVVFLKGGPDALESMTGQRIATPQQFSFITNQYFEDYVPTQPPRVASFVARDPVSGQTTDLGRLDPRPSQEALLDSAALIAGGRVIDPGAGGAPAFGTPWQFEVLVSEPLDPLTATAGTVEMFEIFSDATTSAPDAAPGAPPGHTGNPVQFQVPLKVRMQQGLDAQGQVEVRLLVTPVYTLVDDTRYRITISGTILGLDFRKEFTGDNGLTGDGQTVLSGGAPYAEPGGLGYTTEFLVADRSAITQKRTLTYDPLVDNIQPEMGQTVADENRYNSTLYNPSFAPGRALGKVDDFGDGGDGNLSVGAGTVTVDTGDLPNGPSGISITVTDLDYQDSYTNSGLPAPGARTVNGLQPTRLQLENLVVSPSATLRIIGVNPCRILVRGQVQISGTVDAGGSAGANGSLSPSQAGVGGPGGFAGGRSPKGDKSCLLYGGTDCLSFDGFLNICAGAKAAFPFARKGQGPGRGNQGGDSQPYWAQLNTGGSVATGDNTGTGGGGGSHAASGLPGEDRINAGGTLGTAGPSCSSPSSPAKTPNSSVIGARGMPGPNYGDRTAKDWMGGSGGGGGGSVGEHTNAIGAYGTSGGGGGGGGGFLEIVSAGPINVTSGGRITVAGGQGGAGFLEPNVSPQYGTTYQTSWNTVTGGGGGGAGGSISLVAGGDINLLGGLLDARGGAGGIRGSNPIVGGTVNGSNAGGDGGKGFIFLMDADGQIGGLIPSTPGQYDSHSNGVLTISQFDASRFGSISAVTELFPVLAANPDYQPMVAADILAFVNPNQRIKVYTSSARADKNNPLVPDITTETVPVQVALVHQVSGATAVDILSDLATLNTPGRDAFARIEARFEYDNGVEVGLGPFAYIDMVDLTITFNG